MIQEELHFHGNDLKEQGIEQVLSHHDEWKDRVIQVIEWLSRQRNEFTGDQVRGECLCRGIPEPRHSNAWGAVMSAASKMHIISKTGSYVKSCRPSNHARTIPVWRRY